MPRRRVVKKRKREPDSRYNDMLVTRVINSIMKKGKKSIAEKIFYNALDIIKEKKDTDPLPIFKDAISNVKPKLEVKSRRVGGATFQIPIEVRSDRQLTLSIRWILKSSKARSEYGMEKRLAGELMDAAVKTGGAIKKRIEVYKMAESNKAFAHYKW